MTEKVEPEPRRPLRDEDVIEGSPLTPKAPAKEAPPPSPPPKTVKLKLDGKEYEVAPELHEAIEGYRRDLNERDGKRGSELEGLRRTIAELQDTVKKSAKSTDEPPKSKAPRKPAPELMLTDPERYQEEYDAYRDALEEQRRLELTQRHQTAEQERDAKEANRRAWDKAVTEFYKDNQDLVGEEDLVDLVWRGHYTELKDLPLKDGFKRIAQLTRERIARLSSKGSKKSPEDNLPPALESGALKTPPKPTMADAKPHGTLSDLIRARQRKMRGEG